MITYTKSTEHWLGGGGGCISEFSFASILIFDRNHSCENLFHLHGFLFYANGAHFHICIFLEGSFMKRVKTTTRRCAFVRCSIASFALQSPIGGLVKFVQHAMWRQRR